MKSHKAFWHRSVITWSRFNLHNKQGEKYDVFIEFPQKRFWVSCCLRINSTNNIETLFLSLSENTTFWIKIVSVCFSSGQQMHNKRVLFKLRLSCRLKNDLNQNFKTYNHSKLRFLFKSLARRRQKSIELNLRIQTCVNGQKVSQVYLQWKSTQKAKNKKLRQCKGFCRGGRNKNMRSTYVEWPKLSAPNSVQIWTRPKATQVMMSTKTTY